MAVGLTAHRKPSSDEAPLILIQMPRRTVEMVRDAVASVQHEHPGINLRWALDRACCEMVDKLRRDFNGGQPFPPRTSGLPRGRPRERDVKAFKRKTEE